MRGTFPGAAHCEDESPRRLMDDVPAFRASRCTGGSTSTRTVQSLYSGNLDECRAVATLYDLVEEREAGTRRARTAAHPDHRAAGRPWRIACTRTLERDRPGRTSGADALRERRGPGRPGSPPLLVRAARHAGASSPRTTWTPARPRAPTTRRRSGPSRTAANSWIEPTACAAGLVPAARTPARRGAPLPRIVASFIPDGVMALTLGGRSVHRFQAESTLAARFDVLSTPACRRATISVRRSR